MHQSPLPSSLLQEQRTQVGKVWPYVLFLLLSDWPKYFETHICDTSTSLKRLRKRKSWKLSSSFWKKKGLWASRKLTSDRTLPTCDLHCILGRLQLSGLLIQIHCDPVTTEGMTLRTICALCGPWRQPVWVGSLEPSLPTSHFMVDSIQNIHHVFMAMRIAWIS